jgi:hypothetical protein
VRRRERRRKVSAAAGSAIPFAQVSGVFVSEEMEDYMSIAKCAKYTKYIKYIKYSKYTKCIKSTAKHMKYVESAEYRTFRKYIEFGVYPYTHKAADNLSRPF